MTKVQARFKLMKPLNAKSTKGLADTNSVYGILGMTLNREQDGLTVEYDASRLKEEDVQATLRQAGVDVELV